jgi:hypothetical protein
MPETLRTANVAARRASTLLPIFVGFLLFILILVVVVIVVIVVGKFVVVLVIVSFHLDFSRIHASDFEHGTAFFTLDYIANIEFVFVVNTNRTAAFRTIHHDLTSRKKYLKTDRIRSTADGWKLAAMRTFLNETGTELQERQELFFLRCLTPPRSCGCNAF